jgi:hypothetical protein
MMPPSCPEYERQKTTTEKEKKGLSVNKIK